MSRLIFEQRLFKACFTRGLFCASFLPDLFCADANRFGRAGTWSCISLWQGMTGTREIHLHSSGMKQHQQTCYIHWGYIVWSRPSRLLNLMIAWYIRPLKRKKAYGKNRWPWWSIRYMNTICLLPYQMCLYGRWEVKRHKVVPGVGVGWGVGVVVGVGGGVGGGGGGVGVGWGWGWGVGVKQPDALKLSHVPTTTPISNAPISISWPLETEQFFNIYIASDLTLDTANQLGCTKFELAC